MQVKRLNRYTKQVPTNLYQALLRATNSNPNRKAPEVIRRVRQLHLTRMLTSRQSDEGTGKHNYRLSGHAGLAVKPLDLHLVKVGSIPTGPTHGEV